MLRMTVLSEKPYLNVGTGNIFGAAKTLQFIAAIAEKM